MSIDVFSVGLTGGIGSGKSLVADLFAAQGAGVIDTDQIAHQLTAAGGLAMPLIQKTFGDAFLTSDGALDRARMREHVFAHAAARQQLEKILHPLIAQETEAAAQRSAHAPPRARPQAQNAPKLLFVSLGPLFPGQLPLDRQKCPGCENCLCDGQGGGLQGQKWQQAPYPPFVSC